MDSRINALGAIAEQRLTYEELRNRAKPLKTGIPMLDSYLEGGITPGLMVSC